MKDWRQLPISDKQRQLISDMQEFSVFPLPKFIGTTRGEAADWIDANIKQAHEGFDFEGHYDNFGDRI